MTDRTKLIERIRKLFAMSQDVSSPEEAAIAARRCSKMMEEHGIKEADLATSEFLSDGTGHSFKAPPSWYQSLCIGVATVNDCIAARERGAVKFKGFKEDVLVSQMMLSYLIEAMERELKKEVKAGVVSGRGQTGAFRRGYAGVIYHRLKDIAAERKEREHAKAKEQSTGTSLVVKKMAMVSEQFGVGNYTSGRSYSSSVEANAAYGRGQAAGHRTGLNKQVSTHSQRAIN